MNEKLQDVIIQKLIENSQANLNKNNDIKIKPKYNGLYGKTFDSMKSREAKERSSQMDAHDNMMKYAKEFLNYLQENSIDFDNVESKMEYFTGEYNEFGENPETLELKINLIKDSEIIAKIKFGQEVYHHSTSDFDYTVDTRMVLNIEQCIDKQLEATLDKLKHTFISANINDLCYTYHRYSPEYNKKS